jgi:hypothetical protein
MFSMSRSTNPAILKSGELKRAITPKWKMEFNSNSRIGRS